MSKRKPVCYTPMTRYSGEMFYRLHVTVPKRLYTPKCLLKHESFFMSIFLYYLYVRFNLTSIRMNATGTFGIRCHLVCTSVRYLQNLLVTLAQKDYTHTHTHTHAHRITQYRKERLSRTST